MKAIKILFMLVALVSLTGALSACHTTVQGGVQNPPDKIEAAASLDTKQSRSVRTGRH